MNGTKNDIADIKEMPESLLLLGLFGKNPYFNDNFSILNGERNSKLTSFAGKAYKKDCSETQVLSLLEFMNDNFCESQLNEREINQINSSISRYQEEDSDTSTDNKGKPLPNSVGELIIQDYDIITSEAKKSYLYNFKFWETMPDIKIQNLALRYDRKFTTLRRRSEITSYIQTETFMEKIPWRDIEASQIPFNNGLYDFRENKMLEFIKEQYLDAILPHDYDENAKCPLWLSCLDKWLGLGTDETETIQEFFGYVLMQHAKYKKALICYGEPDTGKSVIGEVLTLMVGRDNVCCIPLDDMDSKRDVAPIKGKMVNLIAELKERAIIAEGGFKKLVSTEEPIQVDAKFEKPETYIPFCKHVVLANLLPEIRDYSDAVYNRLLIIEFKNIIPVHEQDRELLEKLKGEMQGIVRWAVEGAIKLYEAKGHFTIPESTKQIIQKYKKEQNPVIAWSEERLVACDGARTLFTELWEDFSSWDKNKTKDLSRDKFAKLLLKAGYETKKSRIDGKQPNVLDGYKLVVNKMKTNSTY